MLIELKYLQMGKQTNICRGKRSNETEIYKRFCPHKLVYIQARKKYYVTKTLKIRFRNISVFIARKIWEKHFPNFFDRCFI
jgi:hypothetical protein